MYVVLSLKCKRNKERQKVGKTKQEYNQTDRQIGRGSNKPMEYHSETLTTFLTVYYTDKKGKYRQVGRQTFVYFPSQK
jgi:hypothetical protein